MDDVNIIEFDDDDNSYLLWIKQNPFGYVVNTNRSKDPNYNPISWSMQDTRGDLTATIEPGRNVTPILHH